VYASADEENDDAILRLRAGRDYFEFAVYDLGEAVARMTSSRRRWAWLCAGSVRPLCGSPVVVGMVSIV
jgi:hypothetical protein